jgi:tRNA pseudouridine55 synthase
MTQDRNGPALHGWLIIDKPVGPGSTDIVSAVKRALRQGGYAKVKVGHGGTLDPLASGVLPIALGEATKLAGRMLDSDKSYQFTVQFGTETDTLDREGAVVATGDPQPGFGPVEVAMNALSGEIEQIPPIYSALKVGGKRAYDLARAGERPELAPRRVTIKSWQYLGESILGSGDDDVNPQWAKLEVTVSKGTYIRSLARDIAYACGTVGHVTMLRRIKAGPFTLAPAISLDSLAELAKARTLEQALLPLTAGLDDIPALPVTPDQAGALRQGRQVIGIQAPPGSYFATEGSVPVALVEHDGVGVKVVRGFNLS